MDDVWATIEKITGQLDASSTVAPDTEKLLRIMKLTEEAGEVTQAVIGTLGQNPRKGITHTWDDVQAELCDVMFTAMVALATLTPDAPGGLQRPPRPRRRPAPPAQQHALSAPFRGQAFRRSPAKGPGRGSPVGTAGQTLPAAMSARLTRVTT
jgi:phosphoribosyl-ATP pyrophosphohydrolase